MADFWRADEQTDDEIDEGNLSRPTDQSGRKQQITIRLDPGMITDARQIAARKGIGHHTLLRMWVMEGITRAYQEGVLEGPPRSWGTPTRRTAATNPLAEPSDPPAPNSDQPARTGWGRIRPRRKDS